MKKRLIIALGILIVLVATTVTVALAHSGGLAADGCHNDRSTGTRHCHRSQSPFTPTPTSTPTPSIQDGVVSSSPASGGQNND